MKNILINNLYRKGSLSKNKFYLGDLKKIVGKNKRIQNSNNFEYVNGITTFDRAFSNKIFFLESVSKDIQKKLNKISKKSILIIIPQSFSGKIIHPYVKSLTPRETFSKIVSKLFSYESKYWEFDEDQILSKKIGENTKISQNVFVGKKSSIGKNCIIYPNVFIGPNTKIGNNVIIRSGSSIGHPGFGFWKNKKGININLPHVGGVVIEDNVVLGALNTVAAGAIHPTVIENNVVTDDHVHIAHNCYISRGVEFTAGTVLGGSVTVDENAFFGLNSTIKDGIYIGKNSYIGSNTNVIKDVPSKETMIGNPAKILKK